MSRAFDYQVVIIGAGAAGIAASKIAQKAGLSHIVLEASHRVGGRGITEYLTPDIPVDLGCHWMHCADTNPYVKIARQYEFTWFVEPYNEKLIFNNQWASEKIESEFWQYMDDSYQAINAAAENNEDISIFDVIDTGSQWMRFFNYWCSLMHSADVDQISVFDHSMSNDTKVDWAVKGGFGNLIAKYAQGCPVKLNSAVQTIDWQSDMVTLKTTQGDIRANKVILTVSTSVMNAGLIKFNPALPDSKQSHFMNLQLGNVNNLYFKLNDKTIAQADDTLFFYDEDIELYIKHRPFDFDYIHSVVGGRLAWWLEKQGTEAAEDYFLDVLKKLFGSSVSKALGEFKVSAWGADPWTLGAYSVAAPGASSSRAELAKPIDEKLYFAGEATSENDFCTVHGAHRSGIKAMSECLKDLAVKGSAE